MLPARRVWWRLLLESVLDTLVPDSSSPWKNRLQTASQTLAVPSGGWLPRLAPQSVVPGAPIFEGRLGGIRRCGADFPPRSRGFCLPTLVFPSSPAPSLMSVCTFTKVLRTASTLTCSCLYLFRGGFWGLESMKEPSSTLALGPAIEATAIKTKIVACLGSVGERGLRVTLGGLYELKKTGL